MKEYSVDECMYPLVTFKEESTPFSSSIAYSSAHHPANLSGVIQYTESDEAALKKHIFDFDHQATYKFALYWNGEATPYENITLSSLDELFAILTTQVPSVPDLIQIEKTSLKQQDRFSQYTLSCIIYPESHLLRFHPSDILGNSVNLPTEQDICLFIQGYINHISKLAIFPDNILHTELNTPVGQPSVNEDLKRLIFPQSQQNYIKDTFPSTGSLQGLFTIQQRKLNVSGAPFSEQTLISSDNTLTATEFTYIIRKIPTRLKLSPYTAESSSPTTFDGYYTISPSRTPFYFFALNDRYENIQYLLSEEDLLLLNQPTTNYYIFNQCNAKFIACNVKLNSLECIQDSVEWGYAFTTTNEMVFIKITNTDTFANVKKKYSQLMSNLRQRHAEKGTLYDCISGNTGGAHDSFLGYLDAEFHQQMGEHIATISGFPNTTFRPNILQTLFELDDHIISHQGTYLQSPHPALIAYENGILFRPKPDKKQNNTIINQLKDCIPNFKNNPKSRLALFIALALLIAGLTTFFFVEKIIWAGIIGICSLLSLIILYCYNWANYILENIRTKPVSATELNADQQAQPFEYPDPLLQPEPHNELGYDI